MSATPATYDAHIVLPADVGVVPEESGVGEFAESWGCITVSITQPTVKVLWARARDQCAYPGCRQALTEDQEHATTGESLVTPVGQQCHIRSPKPDGPRHDSDYDPAKLDSYENLILLCPTHHAIIDAHDGGGYTVENLIKMRTDHEQHVRRERIDAVIRSYGGEQYGADDKVLFDQIELRGPSVDSMFVDVPFGCRPDATVADLMRRIAVDHPGDVEAIEGTDGQIVTGAAQALLHPEWSSSALLVGGPGQGKSTLLQYVCQFHRARLLGRDSYTGAQQGLAQLTAEQWIPIRLDLRKYAGWARSQQREDKAHRDKRKKKQKRQDPTWPSIEEYIVAEIERGSGGRAFSIEDLAHVVENRPVIIALDGLDEVANLEDRERVSGQIIAARDRLAPDAARLVILVATRPGAATSALWSSAEFPQLHLRRLSHGLRVQYLQRWATAAKLPPPETDKLQRTFMDHQHVPHIQELASYPMQLAILLYLLQRRQLLPQRRTELYEEYLKTFLDREQSEEKEPLLARERRVIEDIHAFIGWYIQTETEAGRSSGAIERGDLNRLLHAYLAGREGGQKLAEKLFSAFTHRVLCLVERETGWFQFDVQSLREYFAAIHIFEDAEPTSRDDCLMALLQRPYWSNVCRFLVGKYSRGEVRGIRPLLERLSEDRDLGCHPMLRSTAAQLLNDRTYEGQWDGPIQEIVDFILRGPGVVLAEDGLLDVSGSALTLTERAGRLQAVRHLRARLENESAAAARNVVADSLRRHATTDDDIPGWWWERFEPGLAWLQAAGRLGVLRDLRQDQESMLAIALSAAAASTTTWLSEILHQGGYDGADDDVLAVVQDEINDGAGEVLKSVDPTIPIGRLINGAAAAQLRPPGSGSTSGTRTRLRRKEAATILTAVVEAADGLRTRPPSTASGDEWQTRLSRVVQVWGDGWVLRQAVAALPSEVDLDTIATSVREEYPALARALTAECRVRESRGEADWWRDQLGAADDGLARRHWVFSLLTRAHSQVVIELASELSGVVDELAPRHIRAIHAALWAFGASPYKRELVLQEALRLHKVEISPGALWLARVVATEASVGQIDKRLANVYADLLQPGMGDMRALVRIAGKSKTLGFSTFRGQRSSLPDGGWASNIKLGAVRPNVATQVLQDPAEWPGDLVQRAAQSVEGRMLAELSTIAELAKTENWFPAD